MAAAFELFGRDCSCYYRCCGGLMMMRRRPAVGPWSWYRVEALALCVAAFVGESQFCESLNKKKQNTPNDITPIITKENLLRENSLPPVLIFWVMPPISLLILFNWIIFWPRTSTFISFWPVENRINGTKFMEFGHHLKTWMCQATSI